MKKKIRGKDLKKEPHAAHAFVSGVMRFLAAQSINAGSQSRGYKVFSIYVLISGGGWSSVMPVSMPRRSLLCRTL